MFKRIGKYIFKFVGGSTVDRVSSWALFTALTFWGPGPIVALIGYEGLVAATIITQTGIIKHTGNKLIKYL